MRLTTYHPCSAECQVFWGLNLRGPLGPSRRPVVGDLYLFIQIKVSLLVPIISHFVHSVSDLTFLLQDVILTKSLKIK